MRRLGLALICAVGIAQAQVPAIIAPIMPSPAGVAISAGKWLYDTLTRDKVYYIEVAGDGRTAAEARDNGFRIAVEQAIGSLIASEAEVQNGRMIRDEIINYSAGYVTRYEILNTEPGDLGSRVTMKVWVKRSTLANRLLNESKNDGEVNGATAAVSVATTIHERVTGDRLVQSVLNDFPRRAFDIEIGKSQVTFDNLRQPSLVVPISVNFSQKYLDSLWAALEATQQARGNAAEITVKSQGMFSTGGTLAFADAGKYNMIASAMIYNKPMVKLSLLNDENRVVFTTLFDMPALTHNNVYLGRHVFVDMGYRRPSMLTQGPASNVPYQMLIDGSKWSAANLLVKVDSTTLAQISRVNVEIVRQ